MNKIEVIPNSNGRWTWEVPENYVLKLLTSDEKEIMKKVINSQIESIQILINSVKYIQ